MMKSEQKVVDAATAALKKLRGTYVNRHAEEIAIAAVSELDVTAAEKRVAEIIGHTTTGARNVEKWTKIARDAAVEAMRN